MDIVLVVGLIVTAVTAVPVMWQLRGHPRGLYVLFFAEMWERFSFYGMRALLIYYLTQHFLFEDKAATAQYGAYATLIWLMPLMGGVIADRWLGMRKAIAFGAVLLTLGELGLALQGPAAQQVLSYGGHDYAIAAQGRGDRRTAMIMVAGAPHAFSASPDGGLRIEGLLSPCEAAGGDQAKPGEGGVAAAAVASSWSAPSVTTRSASRHLPRCAGEESNALPATLPKGSFTLAVRPGPVLYTRLLYLALSLIVVGTGFLKANITSIVGRLYRTHDPRRDPGFTLYYYGMNLGAFWSAAICGAVGESVGWWAGFGIAGLGMAAGLVVFVLGKPWLEGQGEPPSPEALRRPVAGPLRLEGALYLFGLVMVGAIFLVLQRVAAVGVLLAAGSVAVLAYLGWYMATKADRTARERLLLALALIAGSTVFWTLFEQAGSSLSLFAARNTQLPHDGFLSVNAAQTQSFNPGFLLLLAPVFAALWSRLARAGRDPSPAVKFGLALVQVGAGFLVLVAGGGFADAQFRVPLIFLAVAYLLHTTGEFCLSPVGLSQMTKLAPALLISTVMAVWYLSISWAEWIGGLIASLAGSATVGGQVLDPRAALASSLHVFMVIGWVAVGVGVVFLALSPLLKSLAHGASDVSAEPMAPVPEGA